MRNILINLINKLSYIKFVDLLRQNIFRYNKGFVIWIDLLIPFFGALIFGWDLIFIYFFVELLIEAVFIITGNFIYTAKRDIKNALQGFIGSIIIASCMFLVYFVFSLIFSGLFSSHIFFVNSDVSLSEIFLGQSYEIDYASILLKHTFDVIKDVAPIITVLMLFKFIVSLLKNRKGRITPTFYTFIQSRVIVFHIVLLLSAFTLLLPTLIINYVALGISLLTNSMIGFVVISRITTALLALAFGLVSLWNRSKNPYSNIYADYNKLELED